MCLNKQVSNMPRVLNKLKLWIWRGSQYASITQRSKYIRIAFYYRKVTQRFSESLLRDKRFYNTVKDQIENTLEQKL